MLCFVGYVAPDIGNRYYFEVSRELQWQNYFR